MQEIPRPGHFPGAQPVVLVNRPPLGVLCAAAYLALWGLSMGMLAIFTLVAAISAPNPLTLKSLVIAFGGIPIMQALSVSLLVAGYGLATSRPWAAMMTQVAALALTVMLTCIVILGAQSIAHIIWDGANVLLLGVVIRYSNLPQTKRYLAVSVRGL